jgi:hypothetical protein
VLDGNKKGEVIVYNAIFKYFQMILILSLFLTSGVYADQDSEVLVTGDSFVIKTDDTNLLKSRMKSFFNTTEKEYCKAMLKFKLFSMEAKEKKIDMEPDIAAELNQMVEQKLSGIYIDKLVAEYTLIPDTVYSYYLSHTDEFKDKDGNPINFDDNVKKKIREKIMLRKKSEIANKEMEKLMKKYHVEIVNPICSEKE